MLQRQRGGRNRKRPHDDDGRVAQREHQSDSDRPLALLHQLARHVVDGRNVIRIDRMAKSKAVSQKRRAQQHRKVIECDEGPAPCRQIEAQQQGVQGDDLGLGVARFVIEQRPQK